jgi:bifunctional UDP-N-acetylglucosamine pyrophosphorylase/glucosamine-1-phosphate N-acetyltransferase
MTGIAIVLAAGEGKRMNSDLPKVLHRAAGEPLLAHVGRAARESGAGRIVVVVGKGAERVRAAFAGAGWDFVEQPERLGTADAVKRAVPLVAGFAGDVLVLAGDVPLLKGSTLATLREQRRRADAAVSVLTASLPDPTGYGRIVRDAAGEFVAIVEDKDATDAQRRIREVNSSIYCFRAADLLAALPRIGNANVQGEYYLTDAIAILRGDGRRVIAVEAAAPEEILGVNDPAQLRQVDELLARRRPRSGAAPAGGLR